LALPEVRNKLQGLRKTEPHTLGVAVTQVAFENTAPVGIETNGTEGTDRLTHAAADTAIVVDHDPLQDCVPVDGFPGTNL
jgi:hypothetical protein